jgi:glycosyltransferase involved in cell wall biosynthesis
MKPLVIVTAYNRSGATERCLAALDRTTDFSECVVAVVDDRSEWDAWELVRDWVRDHRSDDVHALRMPENGGTARALNYAIRELREPGQPVVKIDNDVEVLTGAWNVLMSELAEALHGEGQRFALLRAWRLYKDTEMPGEDPAPVAKFRGQDVCYIRRDLGYAVWYSGPFMDRVGYFEPLSEDHRYGFDDVIMGHKARVIGGLPKFAWKGWKVRDQARGTAVEDKDEHIAMARPLLRQRVAELHRIRNVRADERGRPV